MAWPIRSCCHSQDFKPLFVADPSSLGPLNETFVRGSLEVITFSCTNPVRQS